MILLTMEINHLTAYKSWDDPPNGWLSITPTRFVFCYKNDMLSQGEGS